MFKFVLRSEALHRTESRSLNHSDSQPAAPHSAPLPTALLHSSPQSHLPELGKHLPQEANRSPRPEHQSHVSNQTQRRDSSDPPRPHPTSCKEERRSEYFLKHGSHGSRALDARRRNTKARSDFWEHGKTRPALHRAPFRAMPRVQPGNPFPRSPPSRRLPGPRGPRAAAPRGAFPPPGPHPAAARRSLRPVPPRDAVQQQPGGGGTHRDAQPGGGAAGQQRPGSVHAAPPPPPPPLWPRRRRFVRGSAAPPRRRSAPPAARGREPWLTARRERPESCGGGAVSQRRKGRDRGRGGGGGRRAPGRSGGRRGRRAWPYARGCVLPALLFFFFPSFLSFCIDTRGSRGAGRAAASTLCRKAAAAAARPGCRPRPGERLPKGRIISPRLESRGLTGHCRLHRYVVLRQARTVK